MALVSQCVAVASCELGAARGLRVCSPCLTCVVRDAEPSCVCALHQWYTVRITAAGATWEVEKRYSEFRSLRKQVRLSWRAVGSSAHPDS